MYFFNSFSKIKIFFVSSFIVLNIAFGQEYKHFMMCYSFFTIKKCCLKMFFINKINVFYNIIFSLMKII